MSGEEAKSAWDFSTAYELLNSFTYEVEDRDAESNVPSPSIPVAKATKRPRSSSKLGDFAELFESLTVNGLLKSDLEHEFLAPRSLEPGAYTSDGVTQGRTDANNVTWDDEIDLSAGSDEEELAHTRQDSGPDIKSPSLVRLETLAKQKGNGKKEGKENRPSKKKRDQLKKKAARKTASEVESESEIRLPAKKHSPAHKARYVKSHQSASIWRDFQKYELGCCALRSIISLRFPAS